MLKKFSNFFYNPMDKKNICFLNLTFRALLAPHLKLFSVKGPKGPLQELEESTQLGSNLKCCTNTFLLKTLHHCHNH